MFNTYIPQSQAIKFLCVYYGDFLFHVYYTLSVSHSTDPSKPQNLTVTNKTSRSLTVEWSTPLTPNGVILNYQVSYAGLESINPVPDSFEAVKTLNLSGTMYTVDVAGLSPHSLYNISVKAFTSVGGGEESTVTIRTEEDGESVGGDKM